MRTNKKSIEPNDVMFYIAVVCGVFAISLHIVAFILFIFSKIFG
jgi:hypothetical protein